jgi:hypothetical protein
VKREAEEDWGAPLTDNRAPRHSGVTLSPHTENVATSRPRPSALKPRLTGGAFRF